MSPDEEPSDLNLTPYLDVLMNLIVFALVSSAGLVTWGVLPASTAGNSDHGARAVVPRVHLSRDATLLDGAPVTLDDLPARLAPFGGRKLVLEAEADVTLEQVVATMDGFHGSGSKRVGLRPLRLAATPTSRPPARKAHFDEVTLAD